MPDLGYRAWGGRDRRRWADALLALRLSCDLTQQDVAARSGISQAGVSRAERGLTVPATIVLPRLLEALGVAVTPHDAPDDLLAIVEAEARDRSLLPVAS